MVMRISKRRDGSYIEGRENLYPRSLFQVCVVLISTAQTRRLIAREQNDDCMQVRAVQAAFPVIGVICAGVSEHLRTGNHALPKLFRKRGERRFVDPERLQPGPGECNRHPTPVLVERGLQVSRRTDLANDPREPSPPLCGLPKRQEFVAPRK